MPWTREAGDGNGRGMVLGCALTGCRTLAGYLAPPGLGPPIHTLGDISCSSATLSGRCRHLGTMQHTVDKALPTPPSTPLSCSSGRSLCIRHIPDPGGRARFCVCLVPLLLP